MGDSVWHLSGGGVGDLNLDFVWDLSLNGVWDLSGDLNWLKGLDFVLFGDVLSLGDLVWNLLDGHNWDLLGNLVLFGHVFGDSVDVGVIGGVSGGVFSEVTNLSPSVLVEATKSTAESSTEASVKENSTIKESSTSKRLIKSESSDKTLAKSLGSGGISSGLSGSLGSGGSGGVGFISSSLASSELIGSEDLFWFGFNTITRVVGLVTNNFSLDWDISGTGLVFNLVGDGLLVSEGSLVGDDWNFTGLDLDGWLVLDFVDSVDTGLLLNSVAGLVLNSYVLIEDGVVSGLSLLSVENSVLVGVTSLWLISVLGDGVRSLEDLDLVSVSVLLFLSVEDFVVSFIGGEWNISVLGLNVVAVGYSWLEGVAEVVVVSVLDFEGFGVSEFLLWLVLDLNVVTAGLDWDLSCSDFLFGSGGDTVLDLVIEDLDVSESFFRSVLGVGVYGGFVVVLDAYGVNGAEKSSDVFH